MRASRSRLIRAAVLCAILTTPQGSGTAEGQILQVIKVGAKVAEFVVGYVAGHLLDGLLDTASGKPDVRKVAADVDDLARRMTKVEEAQAMAAAVRVRLVSGMSKAEIREVVSREAKKMETLIEARLASNEAASQAILGQISELQATIEKHDAQLRELDQEQRAQGKRQAQTLILAGGAAAVAGVALAKAKKSEAAATAQPNSPVGATSTPTPTATPTATPTGPSPSPTATPGTLLTDRFPVSLVGAFATAQRTYRVLPGTITAKCLFTSVTGGGQYEVSIRGSDGRFLYASALSDGANQCFVSYATDAFFVASADFVVLIRPVTSQTPASARAEGFIEVVYRRP